MSNEHHELINEIVALVQDHVDGFRVKWDEFCELVGRSLAEFKQHYAGYAEECERAKASIDHALMNQLFEDAKSRLFQKNKEMEDKGWVVWNRRDTSFLDVHIACQIAAPEHMANPLLWCFPDSSNYPYRFRGPSPTESVLVEYARLSVVHDNSAFSKLSDTDKTIIWDRPGSLVTRKKHPYFSVYRYGRVEFIDDLNTHLNHVAHEHVVRRALARVTADRATKKAPSEGAEEVKHQSELGSHSPDFRSVDWGGQKFSFTGQQAAVVKILWESFENGTPEVGDAYLQETTDSNADRLKDVFRKHGAWATMIVEGQTKGSHCLEPNPKN